MKLTTFEVTSPLGAVSRIGAQHGDGLVDLNAACAAKLMSEGKTGRAGEIADALVPANMVAFLSGGELALAAAKEALTFVGSQGSGKVFGPRGQRVVYAIDDVTLLAPLPRPTSMRDTLSFEQHMINFEKRTGQKTPQRWYEVPIYYKGNRHSVVGPETMIEWPPYTEKLDFELEFGIVIGKQGKDISKADAASYIAGYTIFNDISARDVIVQEVQTKLGPAKAKDMDTGNVLGPWLVTPDELDPSNLKMEARINGETWSSGNSGDMYHSFTDIIAYISQSETLYPGDFIGSGTIANGCGDELDRGIQPGDIIELDVEGIGVLRNTVGPKPSAQ
jgi:2-keto-4-pentenoate hydratase/2-oxohepta-3-ene-1,7-dioic acid hydratase in catechol pathway